MEYFSAIFFVGHSDLEPKKKSEMGREDSV